MILRDIPGVVAGKGHLSQMGIVQVREGQDLVFVSGQVAWDQDGAVVGIGDFDAQFDQVLGNIGRALTAAGGGMDDVVGFRTYLTRRDDVSAFHRARERSYPELFPSGRFPTNTLLIVAGLAEPELLLEIEAVAVI